MSSNISTAKKRKEGRREGGRRGGRKENRKEFLEGNLCLGRIYQE
jgi:hypothetical protein